MNVIVPKAHHLVDTDAVVLRDGRSAELRLLRTSDRSDVTALFESCSAENLYTRFFTGGHSVVTQHLDHLFDTGSGTLSYVLFSEGRLLGIADVEPCGEATAEIAFLVADDAHSLGIATLLLERAAEDGRATGVDWFVADVLAVNRQMLLVFADAGFSLERHTDHGEVSFRMSTRLDEVARSASAARHAAVLTIVHADDPGRTRPSDPASTRSSGGICP